MRPVLAVIVGYGVWTALWLGGGQAVRALWPEEVKAFRDGGPMEALQILVLLLALSAACSLLAGWATALVAQQRGIPLWTLAGLLLATGVAVQAGMWKQMPTWYHAVFLLGLVPLIWAGSQLWRGNALPN